MSSHQVVITFDLDENTVKENAEKEAGREIANRIINNMIDDAYYYDKSSAVKKCTQKILTNTIVEILETEKDKIINEAIKELVLSLSRTKAVKEKLQEVLNDGE